MLKGGDAFRKSRQHFIKQREKIFHSAIETVFHQYSETADSREYAYILALINCSDNEVTEIGRDPDAYLYEDQYTQISPLDYALVFSYFGGIRWLIQNRHANIYLKNQNGYDPIAQSLKVFEDIYKTYHTFLESCGSVTDAHTNYKIAEFTHHFRRMVHVLYWIKSCTGGRLDLHKYHRKYPNAVALVENNPQTADSNSKDFYYTAEEQGAALQQHFEPNIVLAKRGSESGDTGMRKRFQSPLVSRANPSHPLSLPGLTIQYQTLDAPPI